MEQTEIFVVGDSGAGKSFLIAWALKDPDLRPYIQVATRYTTRRPRRGETLPEENTFVDEEEFHRLRLSNVFSYAWPKSIPGGHDAWYGFVRSETARPIVVYPANLQFLQTEWRFVPSSERRALILRVEASIETRNYRILERGALSQEELRVRLVGPPPESLRLMHNVVIRNDIDCQETALFAFVAFLKGFLHA